MAVSSAPRLQELQEADTRLAQVRAEIDEVRAALAGDAELDRRRGAAAAAAQTRQDAERDATAAEQEVAALGARIRSLDRRLYDGSVRNPQDLLEMQRELETLRGRGREAEDRALTLLEQAEEATSGERDTLRVLDEQETRRANALEPLRERLAALTATVEKETAARDAVAASIDARDLALYARVANRRTPAVVRMAGDACGGCHLPLSNEERHAVRAGERIVQCANCDRILVR